MKKIFFPLMGRINTQNRDGGEIRLAKFLLYIQNHFEIYILAPERQLIVSGDQGVDLKKFNSTIFRDITSSERDSILNQLLIYGYRMLRIIFTPFPNGIDIIYVPSDFFFDVLPALICKLRNPRAKVFACSFLICPNPFIKFSDVNSRKYSLPNVRQLVYFLTQRVSYLILKLMKSHVFLLNKADVDRLAPYFKDCTEVSMGIDVSEYESVSEESKIYDAIYVGRLHPQKGIERLLASWKLVCQREPRLLCIIGGGSEKYREQLENQIKRLEISENVVMLGFKSGIDKIRFLKSSKIAVVPSIYESFGGTVVEAGICKLPVVAFDIPIFRLLFGQFLIFSDEGNIQDYADNILLALTEDQADRINKFYYFCEALDWHQVFKREVNLLEK